MSDNKLKAERRTEFGKGAARQLRRDGRVPAVMYGHGQEPVHLSLDAHDAMLALKHANALLTISLDGEDRLGLAKDVQRDPIKPIIKHVDLINIVKGEKVTVDVSIHVEGQAAPDTLVTHETNTLQIQVDATDIPDSITVSVEGLEVGSQIHASEVTLPAGAELVADPDQLVINVVAAPTAEPEPTEEATEEAGEAAAEAPAEGESAGDAPAEDA